jgi:hypothetical protein
LSVTKSPKSPERLTQKKLPPKSSLRKANPEKDHPEKLVLKALPEKAQPVKAHPEKAHSGKLTPKSSLQKAHPEKARPEKLIPKSLPWKTHPTKNTLKKLTPKKLPRSKNTNLIIWKIVQKQLSTLLFVIPMSFWSLINLFIISNDVILYRSGQGTSWTEIDQVTARITGATFLGSRYGFVLGNFVSDIFLEPTSISVGSIWKEHNFIYLQNNQ